MLTKQQRHMGLIKASLELETKRDDSAVKAAGYMLTGQDDEAYWETYVRLTRYATAHQAIEETLNPFAYDEPKEEN